MHISFKKTNSSFVYKMQNTDTFCDHFPLHYKIKIYFTNEQMQNQIVKKLVPSGTDDRLLWSGFQALLTLTLDQVIRHTVVHQSSASIYIPNFTEIGKRSCKQTNRMDPSKFKVM